MKPKSFDDAVELLFLFDFIWLDTKLRAVAGQDSAPEDYLESEIEVESDIVNCVCGIRETSGLMIQVSINLVSFFNLQKKITAIIYQNLNYNEIVLSPSFEDKCLTN